MRSLGGSVAVSSKTICTLYGTVIHRQASSTRYSHTFTPCVHYCSALAREMNNSQRVKTPLSDETEDPMDILLNIYNMPRSNQSKEKKRRGLCIRSVQTTAHSQFGLRETENTTQALQTVDLQIARSCEYYKSAP